MSTDGFGKQRRATVTEVMSHPGLRRLGLSGMGLPRLGLARLGLRRLGSRRLRVGHDAV